MAMIKAIRRFFDAQGFYEVETPALQVMPCADTHIHGFHTEFFGPDLKKQRDFYLHTSPEFEMKKLLVAGLPTIYQICHVFRNGETTRLHSPEFTMLEWYRAHADYNDIMEDCKALLRGIASDLGIREFKSGELACDPFAEWEIISVREAFQKYAGFDLLLGMDDPADFQSYAEEAGVPLVQDSQLDDTFHAFMAHKIEPYLGVGRPTILCDYPNFISSLAKECEKDRRFVERFELYVCGIELANAFSELIDADKQRENFILDMAAKESLYGFTYPVDEDFLKALEYGMPESGGIALGVDRLAMLYAGVDDISKILWSGKPV